MKIVIFGLSLTSAWGNGHATLWRALLRALIQRGHFPVFYERNLSFYARNRDLTEVSGARIVLYERWEEVRSQVTKDLRDANVSVVTSYCPDSLPATGALLRHHRGLRVFYDLDTPVTLDALHKGEPVPYIPPNGLADFDLVLSYTGGQALTELQSKLGARSVAPLYGSVDPDAHKPASPRAHYAADLSYLGTYAEDRQPKLEELLVAPAQRQPAQSFLIAGAQYPANLPLPFNVRLLPHVPPPDHSAFYNSARLNLNITRAAMARMGYCPSGRLFEAAACGAPLLSDYWPGLETFFEPDKEVLIAHTAGEVIEALRRDDLGKIAAAARQRTLEQHTAHHRAQQFESLVEGRVPAGAQLCGA